jgi:hypothetical protein
MERLTMSLPTITHDIDTDAAGNGTLITDPVNGWLSEIQVNYTGATSNGTLTITGLFNGVTETLLDGIIGNTDNTFPVVRPLVDKDNADSLQFGYWNLTGQKLTCLLTGANGPLTPALQIKFGGSR